MLFPYILYAKVINKEAKLNGAPFVVPKARTVVASKYPALLRRLRRRSLANCLLWGRP